MIVWDVTTDARNRLEPRFRADATALLASSPYDFRVVYAYRSMELQQQLYDVYLHGGPRAAPPGKSPHNYGLAVDVQLWVQPLVRFPDGTLAHTSPDKVLEWNVKAPGWQWLFDAVYKSPHLHSGISFGDFDHIERVNWKLYKDWNQ